MKDKDFQIRILARRDIQGSRERHIAPEQSSNPASSIDLGERFLRSCSENKKRIALTTTRSQYSYEWLDQRVASFAETLVAGSPFKPGDHVGLYLENSIEYVVAFYGSLLAGGVVVPVPRFHKGQKLLQLCELSELTSIVDSFDSPDEVVNLFQDEQSIFDSMPSCAAIERRSVPAGQDSLAMLMFTSGSTGDPKAVMLSHRNLISNCVSICQFLPIMPADRAMVVTPFSHALGNSVLQTHLLTGAELVIPDRTKFPTEVLNAISYYDCTSITAVPEFFEGLMLAMDGTAQQLSRLRYMAVAGGKMDSERAIQLQTQIASADFYIMYGQTEATARLAYLPPEQLHDAAGSIGLPIPGVELTIKNRSGQSVECGNIGTLHAKGENIMLGYWKDAPTTNEVLKDGWLKTGDLARMRPDGFLEICGRENGLIKVQGYRFHPDEVVQYLSRLLTDVKLIVEPIDYFGKTRLALFAQSTTQRPLSLMELRQACRQVLPSHMTPQRFKICESWPLNSAGKIDHQALISSLSNAECPSHNSKLQNELSFGNQLTEPVN